MNAATSPRGAHQPEAKPARDAGRELGPALFLAGYLAALAGLIAAVAWLF